MFQFNVKVPKRVSKMCHFLRDCSASPGSQIFIQRKEPALSFCLFFATVFHAPPEFDIPSFAVHPISFGRMTSLVNYFALYALSSFRIIQNYDGAHF